MGEESSPYCCCSPGTYVYVKNEKKYWIGPDSKDCLCGGDDIAIKDIWNAERTLRIGHILYIARTHCCLYFFRLFFDLKTYCLCVSNWN